MESGQITDSQLSSEKPEPPTFEGTTNATPRLHQWEGLSSGWVLGSLGRGNWIQIDLLTLHTVTGVTVQAGRYHQYSLWMDLFRLLYAVPPRSRTVHETGNVATRRPWQIYRRLDGNEMVSGILFLLPPPRPFLQFNLLQNKSNIQQSTIFTGWQDP